MLTLADLRESSLDALEAIYREAPIGPRPRGRFRGHALLRVDSRLARSSLGSLILLPFEHAPFGIDFRRANWFFVHDRMRIGQFRVEQGRSRWRDAEVLRLEYDVSRLPRPIRRFLYDEVKPLTETLCLGLGGIRAGHGKGDLFFFALEPLRD
jgi:hypothetical protein